MSAGTHTLTMPRNGLSLSGIWRQTWQDPQNSIGLSCGQFGGIPCWTVKGDAKILFEQIADGVKELLENHMDDIEKCQTNREAVGWSMYMMGRDISHAKPVFVFDCFDRKTRTKVVEIVKKSKLWKKTIETHPALRLASHARVPQECGSSANIPSMPDVLGEVYSDGTRHDLCGTQIYVHLSQDSSFRVATLGGIILVNDVPHGITVAHIFKDRPEIQNFPEDNDEFTFEVDSEIEDDASTNETSRGTSSFLLVLVPFL
jgi:hypothetical protein